MGLVAYRDRGDAYVTQVVDLNRDLDSMYAKLMDFEADGGGDGPEAVNEALEAAIQRMSWSQDQSTYKVVFLVGDAPPHMDYQDDVKYRQVVAAAVAKGIVVNTIQCGSLGETVAPWQHIASLGRGRYFTVEQAGSAVAIETPFDAQIATLAAELDGTRLYYGSREQQAAMAAKVDAIDRINRRSVGRGARAARRVQRQRRRRGQLRRERARRRRRERPRRHRRGSARAAAGRRRGAARRRTARARRADGAETRGAQGADRGARRAARRIYRGGGRRGRRRR